MNLLERFTVKAVDTAEAQRMIKNAEKFGALKIKWKVNNKISFTFATFEDAEAFYDHIKD